MRRVWLPVAVLLVLLLVPLWLSCQDESPVKPARDEAALEDVEETTVPGDVPRVERMRPESDPEPDDPPAPPTDEAEDNDRPHVSVMFSPHDTELDATRIRVQGRVVDEAGEPIAGERVQSVASLAPFHQLRWGENRTEASAVYSWTKTGADGRFEIEVLESTPFLVRVVRAQEGSSLAPTAADVLHEEEFTHAPDDWTIVVARLSFVGTIIGPDGSPLPGALAQVRLEDRLGLFPQPRWVEVDDQGRFRFTAAQGLGVRVSAQTPTNDLRGWRHVFEAGEFTLELLPPRTYSLRLFRDREGGGTEEIAGDLDGLKVDVLPFGEEVVPVWDPESRVWHVTAGLPLGPNRRPVLRATAAGCLSARVCVLPDPAETVSLHLLRPSRVRVRLVDGEGTPVGGARVIVESYGSGSRAVVGGLTSDRTDADGVALIPGVVPNDDDALLRIHVGERIRSEVRIRTEAAGRTADLGTITLGPASAILGRVLDPDGQPIAGIAVAAARRAPDSDWELSDRLMGSGSGLATISAEDGTFRIDGITAGLWDVVAWKQGRPMAVSRGLSIDGGDKSVELRMARPRSVIGVLLNDDGDPLPGQELEILVDHPIDIALLDTITTGDDGRFRYDGFDATTDEVWVQFDLASPDEPGEFVSVGAYVRPGELTILRPKDLVEFDPEAHDKRRGR